jgi:malate/lactate dehydrogenase
VCEATLFPRARIIGVDGGTEPVLDVVDAIVLDRKRVFDCVARCEGERGIDGEFAKVPVRVGAGGIQEIVED